MIESLLDPAGHIKISVSDINKSKSFYKELFAFLNWKLIREKEESAAWVSPEGFGFWIAKAKAKTPKHKHSAPGIHPFCFKVDSEQIVNKLYLSFLKKKQRIYDPPAHYPQYTQKYYAVFFADPDGIKLEAAYY